jgi:hypothetical protein
MVSYHKSRGTRVVSHRLFSHHKDCNSLLPALHLILLVFWLLPTAEPQSLSVTCSSLSIGSSCNANDLDATSVTAAVGVSTCTPGSPLSMTVTCSFRATSNVRYDPLRLTLAPAGAHAPFQHLCLAARGQQIVMVTHVQISQTLQER